MMDMSKGFEPQLSKKGAAPKQYDIAIEVTVREPSKLPSNERQSLQKLGSSEASGSGPAEAFTLTLKGNYMTVGDVRKAIGEARGCDPDLVGLATDDGPLLEEDALPPQRLAMVGDSSKAERERMAAVARRVRRGRGRGCCGPVLAPFFSALGSCLCVCMWALAGAQAQGTAAGRRAGAGNARARLRQGLERDPPALLHRCR